MELNPGHLESLRQLGILDEQETTISPQELAERIAKSEKITQALDDGRKPKMLRCLLKQSGTRLMRLLICCQA